MRIADPIHVEIIKNAIEADLLRAKARAADLVERDHLTDEEMRLFLAATCVRLGLAPGEPEVE